MNNRNTRIKIQSQLSKHQQVKEYHQGNINLNKLPINYIKTKSKQQFSKNQSVNDLNHLELSITNTDTYSDHKNNHHFYHQSTYTPKHHTNQTQLQNGYKKIQNFLQNQNRNLRQQNKMLMSEINVISKKQKKYKDLYNEKIEELRLVQQQKNIYKKQVEQLKAISMYQMNNFKKKLQYVTMDNLSNQKKSPYQSLQYQSASVNNLSTSSYPNQQYNQDYRQY